MKTVIGLASLVYLMLQVSMLCSRIYLHCFLAHRAIVRLHPVVAMFMHLWLSVLMGLDPRKWAWKHRDHHNYQKVDPYNPFGRSQWHVFAMTWWYYARGTPTLTDCPDYRSDWIDTFAPIRYRGVSGFVILMLTCGWMFHSWNGVVLGAGVWCAHLFLYTSLYSALNAFAHDGGKIEGSDTKARNVWWLFPLTWGESFHKNHHDHPRRARFAELDPAWPIIRGLEVLNLASTAKQSMRPRSNHTDRIATEQESRRLSEIAR
jgi:fatty-acid desaturase